MNNPGIAKGQKLGQKLALKYRLNKQNKQPGTRKYLCEIKHLFTSSLKLYVCE